MSKNHPIQELKHICNTQKSISTSRLIKIVRRVEESYIAQGKSVRRYKKLVNQRKSGGY